MCSKPLPFPLRDFPPLPKRRNSHIEGLFTINPCAYSFETTSSPLSRDRVSQHFDGDLLIPATYPKNFNFLSTPRDPTPTPTRKRRKLRPSKSKLDTPLYHLLTVLRPLLDYSPLSNFVISFPPICRTRLFLRYILPQFLHPPRYWLDPPPVPPSCTLATPSPKPPLAMVPCVSPTLLPLGSAGLF